MSWNMPEGISENDIPENEELAPNQLAEIEFLEWGFEQRKKGISVIEILKNHVGGVTQDDYELEGIFINMAQEIESFNIYDYISEPITEDREPNEGEE